MGKAVPRGIKVRADTLIKKFPTSFTTDFGKNKEFLDSLGIGWSKTMRNLIAGHITKRMKSSAS